MPCSTLAEAPSSREILRTIKDLPGCLDSPRKWMLACISREMRCVCHITPENADMHADAGKSPRLLDEVRGCFGLATTAWVPERFQVHLLARQLACEGVDAGPRVACFGLSRDEAESDPRDAHAGGVDQPCSSAAS